MADAPRRIQRMRTKGWRMPAGAVYVGRPGPFGNACKIEQVDGVGWCITDTETGLTEQFDTLEEAHIAATARYWAKLATKPELVERIRRELRGRDLCCYCGLRFACHVDVLLEVANA